MLWELVSQQYSDSNGNIELKYLILYNSPAKLILAMKVRLRVNKKYIKIIGLAAVLFALSLTLILVKQSQDQRSSAASPDKLETEGGVLSSTGVTKVSDSGVSGGQYVAFTNQTSSPTPTTSPSQGGIGPRYSFYGAGSNANFPSFPTGSNVKVVPSSVPHNGGGDAAKALREFINAQPDGTIIVFDQSGGGSKYGNGTLYELDDVLWISGGSSSVFGSEGVTKVRKNITLWGYNTRIKKRNCDRNSALVGTNSAGPSIMLLNGGGFENLKVLGFDIMGPNYLAGTWDARSLCSESNHGINITSYDGLTIKDNYIHEVGGDFVALYGWGLGTSYIYPQHYGGYDHGPWVENAEISYNLMDKNGRMGILINQGNKVWVHHNIIKNVALGSIDLEDGNYNPVGLRWVKNLTIEDNVFDGWEWHLPKSKSESYWYQWVYQFVHGADRIDLYENFVIQRNRYERGNMGLGNPNAERERWGAVAFPNGPGGIRFGKAYHSNPNKMRNLTIKDNVSNIPSDQLTGDGWEIFYWGGNIVVTGNRIQGMPYDFGNLESGAVVTFENNGSSPRL